MAVQLKAYTRKVKEGYINIKLMDAFDYASAKRELRKEVRQRPSIKGSVYKWEIKGKDIE